MILMITKRLLKKPSVYYVAWNGPKGTGKENMIYGG